MRLLPLPGVFQPISDSWMLASCLERERLGPGSSALDLCTGSGLLAVVAALRGAESTAIDVSRRAVLSARVNARLNGVRVRAVRGDLFEPVNGRRFDVIVSNPPYVPVESDALPASGPERAWHAGRSGRVFIDRICQEAATHLKSSGVLLMVHSTVCDEPRTLEAMSAHGLEPQVVLRQPGPLGPRLRPRAERLHQEGRLPSPDREEIIVVRATLP